MFVCIATSLAPLFPLHLIFNMPLRSFSHCPTSWSNLSPLTHFIPSDNDHVDNDYHVDKSGDQQSDENNDDEDDEDDDKNEDDDATTTITISKQKMTPKQRIGSYLAADKQTRP